MPRGRKNKGLGPAQWYIREWMAQYEKIQANLESELEWSKNKASKVFNLQQRHNEEILKEISAWLNVRPYELLMHPDDAFALRRMEADARRIADKKEAPPPGAEILKTGTKG